ncbi:UDP-3-O-[3-hydroxymyristoyl] N-acetylglucosamine deacetylase 2 [Pyrus ussuriensis x Pyrus communis]|uniref:UDP-3-O-acyl-N-acetylglucosamine deacetylase n=1 Tax=Pyrus ussuriensis x Pyrus communis TaxID=2448454 RepID=A0A5N5H1V6_9ROSA|nr:UDP-3-O-[3-hydroxymyristoyl] N-acetylglucosamine deacetylase 2 [Pyrus ussuriensis x Pyrus communis]
MWSPLNSLTFLPRLRRETTAFRYSPSIQQAMTLSSAFNAFKSSKSIFWKSTGRLQRTLAGCIEGKGKTLHSGKVSAVKLWPDHAGKGRYFVCRSNAIRASIEFTEESPLCTTLCKDGLKIRTVEHLLSALEAMEVDNCRIEIKNSDPEDIDIEVPIFDGSAREWVEAIKQVGLKEATDEQGNCCEKMAAHMNEPVHVWRNNSFVAAFPSPEIRITYGIDFPQVDAIGCQWFSVTSLDNSFYSKQIALSRTFCIYEEVEQMRKAGLIKGGGLENAIVCSSSKGWLNPPLRFPDEPCRHKVLDLIGDLSLFARFGSQGLPVAHIVAYKGGHALHSDLVRRLSETI